MSHTMLTDWQIKLFGEKMISPFYPENLSPDSIDLTLDKTIKIETTKGWEEVHIGRGYALRPNQFILAMTRETVKIPNNYSGLLFTKSGDSRQGLTHTAAKLIHSGFEGKIVLELKNYSEFNSILLSAGMPIIQLGIIHHAYSQQSYKGNYQNQVTL